MQEKTINSLENNCCGCEACAQSCPKTCITMEENNRGFLVPKINDALCIKCGICRSVCPEINDIKVHNSAKKSYAVIIKDKEEQRKSTSGGVFFELAKLVLSNGGVVAGAVWDDDLQVKHVIVDNLNDLASLRQSKYVQSRIENTYLLVKKQLDLNNAVLFSGTACQIAGLKCFLKKQYNSLLTVEVACHGVPSPGLFRKYLQWLEDKEKARINKYSFRNRDKHESGEHYKACAEFDNGHKKYFYIDSDPYYCAFLNGKTLRKTCYHCKYKSRERVSDITLCDFWGIEKEMKSFPAKSGVSGVLINTPKAIDIFNEIEDKLIFKECSVDAIYKHNKSMISSFKNSGEHFTYSIDNDFSNLSKDLLGKNTLKRRIKKIIKIVVPSKIKYLLKRM